MTAYTPSDLLARVIRPALAALGLDDNPDVSMLLLRTAAQESGLGASRTQIGGGPALGVWQMEPNTCTDIWTNRLKFRPQMSARVTVLLLDGDRIRSLAFNDQYACAMARIQYMRTPLAIPPAGDVEGQAAFYLKFYNAGGKATADEFIANARAIETEGTS